MPVKLGYGVLVVDVPLAAAVADDGVLALEARGAADRAAHRRADAPGVEGGDLQAAVGQGLTGRDDRELRGPVEPAGLLLGEPGREGVEVDLGGDLRAER